MDEVENKTVEKVSEMKEGDIPRSFHFGQSIDWDSELIPIQLNVELPFWLVVPDSTYKVPHNGCTLNVTVSGHFAQIQLGREYLPSQVNSAFVGDLRVSQFPSHLVPLRGYPRTVIAIKRN